jgi:hypothetical protein
MNNLGIPGRILYQNTHPSPVYLFIYLSVLGFELQGPALARQTLCYLGHASSPILVFLR